MKNSTKNNYKCIIIYPPNQLMDVETPRPDGSLGPLYLASALEKIGIETDVLDASVGSENYSLKDTFYRRIRQGNGLIRIGMNFNEIADYVDKGKFMDSGTEPKFHHYKQPAYLQLWGDFIPNLSVIDMLFNVHPSELKQYLEVDAENK